ncbi:MAG: radical SAM protein [Sphingobacteriales bacterium]|nr:MAG: radical SAM protein [Sphingobacteriales bacterium]TAF80199.1 MAG: radical SAM protein [Sphingobacteriales bacterium]
MIKISAVSYTNTLPFIYGLTHSGINNDIQLSLDVPAICAQKLKDNQVDIGLIPVAAITDLPQAQLISDYCIGANGAVNSVFIFSNCPISEVKFLQLDAQSKTSNQLALVLMKYYWHIEPQLIVNADNYAQSAQANTAFVQIGDRTFGQQNKFAYAYDLAAEWKNYTGLPFVFAVWVSNKKLDNKFIETLNAAFKLGLDNRNEVLKELKKISNFELKDYLYNKIEYHLDTLKLKALARFNRLMSNLHNDTGLK